MVDLHSEEYERIILLSLSNRRSKRINFRNCNVRANWNQFSIRILFTIYMY